MVVSPQTTTSCYEIWLFAPGESPELLNECGLYRSRESADAVRNAVADWFRLGKWVDAVMDGLPVDVCEDLFARRQSFKAADIDPGDVLLAVKRVERHGPRLAVLVPDLDADEEDDDATALQMPDVMYSNCQDV